jgi:hypothetical protein
VTDAAGGIDRRRVLAALIEEERRRHLARGIPVLDEQELAARVEAAVDRAERVEPRFLERAAARLRAESSGRRLTFCRLVRGSHGGAYVYDPQGTDEPPAWWSLEAAMRARRAPRRHDALGDPVTRAADAERAREAVVGILARLREREAAPPLPRPARGAGVSADTPGAPAGGRQVRRRLALG